MVQYLVPTTKNSVFFDTKIDNYIYTYIRSVLVSLLKSFLTLKLGEYVTDLKTGDLLVGSIESHKSLNLVTMENTHHIPSFVVVVFKPSSHDFREEPPTDPKSMPIICLYMYPARWFLCWIHGKLDRQDRKKRHGGSLWQGR